MKRGRSSTEGKSEKRVVVGLATEEIDSPILVNSKKRIGGQIGDGRGRRGEGDIVECMSDSLASCEFR
jgi:hypothetical protein